MIAALIRPGRSRCGHRFGLASLGLLILTIAGCGGGTPAPTDAQAKVTGKATYDGKPLPVDSAIVFYCPEKAATASGKVDSLGGYSLTGSMPGIGIPAGRYQVMFSAPALPPPVVGTPEYEQAMMGHIKDPPLPKEIPQKFTSFATSKLVLEVKEGDNTFDFDLAKL
ncbi:MAG: hypothetical protein KDA75_18570 [Planctomycetaceae bacterium]|nr:hypothetical protein [Planctomycetaceae bacterium]